MVPLLQESIGTLMQRTPTDLDNTLHIAYQRVSVLANPAPRMAVNPALQMLGFSFAICNRDLHQLSQHVKLNLPCTILPDPSPFLL